jgi:hypothetical protein|tara:strand:- start:220 stop:618 length:399 start_codon:yes stop_codon:yes gene_type:complete
MKIIQRWRELASSGNDMNLGSNVEVLYDEFLSKVKNAYPKVNSILLIKIMALERKFSDSLPHVHLEVEFKEDTNTDRPKYDISEKHHVQVAVHRWEKTKLVVTGMMNVDVVAEIASHKSVVKIIGSASAAYY